MTFRRVNDGYNAGTSQSRWASGTCMGPPGADGQGQLGEAKAPGRVAWSL